MDIEKIKSYITETEKKLSENKRAYDDTKIRAESLILENAKLQGELRFLSKMLSENEVNP